MTHSLGQRHSHLRHAFCYRPHVQLSHQGIGSETGSVTPPALLLQLRTRAEQFRRNKRMKDISFKTTGSDTKSCVLASSDPFFLYRDELSCANAAINRQNVSRQLHHILSTCGSRSLHTPSASPPELFRLGNWGSDTVRGRHPQDIFMYP